MEHPRIDGFNVNDMFCATPGCVLNIPHNGKNWATVRLPGGSEQMLDRHPLDAEGGKCYCTRCRLVAKEG